MQQMKNPNLFPTERGSDFSCVVEAMGVELITGDSTWKIFDFDPQIGPLLWMKIPLTE